MKKILILAIFILTLFSFSTCFALTDLQYERLLTRFGGVINNETINYLKDVESRYTYQTVIVSSSTANSLSFYFHNSVPIGQEYGYSFISSKDAYQIVVTNGNITYENQSTNFNIHYEKTNSNSKVEYYFYTTSGIKDNGEFIYSQGYEKISVINNTEILPDSTIPDTEDSESGDISGDFQVTLPAIVQETQPEEVLAEIVGLLPIVMVCLVCWIGLRKALQLLLELLKQS